MNEVAAVPLGDLMETKAGSIDPSKFPTEPFDLYSIPAFDRGEPDVAVGSSIGSSKQIVKPGDVLLSRIVPHIRRSCVVGSDRGRRIIASGEWIVFRSDKFHAGYLRHVLVGDPFHAQFMNTVAGVGGSLLRARPNHVANITIPLPPLPEQRRIAAILDQADALRAKRRAALAKLETLAQSVFLDMFGNPTFNPKGWPVVRLKEAVELVQIGPFGSLLHQSDYIDGGVPVINPMHIVNGQIQPNPKHSVARDHIKRLHKYVLRRSDIVMGRRGEMGRCAVVGPEEDGMLCGSGSLIIRPDLGRTTSDYLQTLLSSAHFIRTLEHEALGVTMLNLNSTIVEGLRLPLPELEEQLRYGRIVERLSSHQRSVIDSAAQLDQLRGSLQRRAFRGEL